MARVLLALVLLLVSASAEAQQTVRTTGTSGGSGGDITISGSALSLFAMFKATKQFGKLF
jgi:hypothetical protein